MSRRVLTTLGALALSLAGESLIVFARLPLAGAALLLAGVSIWLWTLARAAPGLEVEGDLSRRWSAFAMLGILAAGFVLRRWQIQAIPWGLNNDEGIEGLIACRFLAGERIAPFSSIGVARETLYHLLLMPLISLMGPTMASLRLLSLLCALGAIILIERAGAELFSRRVGLGAAFLLSVSPWHLLYSRVGLRNILLPVLLLAGMVSFARALRGRKPAMFALTGALLAAGMYSYTSFRVVPLAFLLWALLRSRLAGSPPMSWKETALTVGSFTVLMIPQLWVFSASPAAYLARGAYVLTQTPDASIGQNLFFSLVMPVAYPAKYGVMQSRWYFGDGVSLVYAAVGRTPESVVSATLMALGFAASWVRLIRRRSEGEGVLLLLFATTLVTVGLAGPSLTRLIGLLPLLCLMGALALEEIRLALRGASPHALAAAVTGALLAGAAVLGFEQYFLSAGRSPKAMFYFAAPQTIMGLYAAGAATDHPVHIFYTEEPETLQFLTFAQRERVTLQHDPQKADWRSLPGAGGRQEFVMENQRAFLPVFTEIAQANPWADATMLTDPQHRSSVPVAYVLDLNPAHRTQGPAGPGASAPPPPP